MARPPSRYTTSIRRWPARRTTSATTTPYLDTDFQGIEITANKRFSNRWQMVAGLTFGKNEGGLTQGAAPNDLNDPNVTLYERGIIGNDSTWGFRASGSYVDAGRRHNRRVDQSRTGVTRSSRPTR